MLAEVINVSIHVWPMEAETYSMECMVCIEIGSDRVCVEGNEDEVAEFARNDL
jgi:hypothetical protein